MKQLRLVLVTRRFWPLVGGAEQVMANLSSELDRHQHHVQLLTARWEKHWPLNIEHRAVPVTRIKQPATRGWGTLRYMRSLARWLKSNRDQIDAVLVSMLKHDAYSAIGAMKESAVPVILRAEGGGETGDCHWHEQGSFGSRIRSQCKLADAIIAPSRQIVDELSAAGFDGRKTNYVPNGVAVLEPWSKTRRGNARAVLADAHEVFTAQPDAPVVVYTGRLHHKKGLMDLVNCWPNVLQEFPEAKLWLVGEGPDGVKLWDRILELRLTERVILAGTFDEISEVLYAADAYVLPSYEEGMSLALLEAMSASTPIVASDIPGNRQLIDDGVHGRLCEPGDSDLLASTIIATLKDQLSARTMANAARQRVVEQFSINRMTERHLEIIRSSIESRRATR